MTNISKVDFLACVKKSRVIEPKRFDVWLAECDASDPTEIATKMVRENLLTKWQAKYLMAGRTRLDIGSYRLLERIQRDELGDRFLAIHIQLGRKVNIQVLPADLTKDKSRCESFIHKASQSAKLDHPNLIHVIDIDQEGGRYFLVTEHFDGVTLDLAARSSMSDLDVANIVNQAIAGIQFAHFNDVNHGDLTQKDLVITKGDGVKVQNLAVSLLRSNHNGSSNNGNDIRSAAAIGKEILNEIPAENNEDRLALENILNAIETADTSSMAESCLDLSGWLSEHQNGSDLSSSDADNLFDFSGGTDSSTEGEFDQPIASTLASQPRKAARQPTEDEFDEEPEKQPGYLARFAKENPVALIATALTLTLLIVGFSAWGFMRLNSNTAKPKIVQDTTTPVIKSNKPKQNLSVNNSKPPKSNLANADIKAVNSGGILSQSTANEPKPDFNDTEAMKRLIEGVVPGNDAPNPTNTVATIPSPTADNPSADSAATTETSAPVSSTEIPAAKGQPDVEAETRNPDTNPNPTNPNLNTTVVVQPNSDIAIAKQVDAPPAAGQTAAIVATDTKPAEVANPAEKTAETIAQQPAAEVDPFKDLPRLTELPPLEDLTEFKISDLRINNRFLMGAEIYTGEAICKTKLIIELNRSADDKQKWIVSVRRREKEKPVEIAIFRRSETALLFQWLPVAAETKFADHLRNCFLKLQLPEFNTWLTLRKPVELEPMVLTAEQTFAAVETELASLPRLENISIEVLPMRIPNIETSLNPRIIEFQNGLPGRILLKQSDENAFVWIQVGADLKSKLRLQSAFVLFVNGQVQPFKNIGGLNELPAGLKQIENAAFANWDAAKKKKAPSGKGEEYDLWRGELEKTFNLAKEHTGKAIEYAQLAPQLLGQPISIRVNANMGDGHEIELAIMKASSGQ